jgi:hypothetical protein
VVEGMAEMEVVLGLVGYQVLAEDNQLLAS